MNATAKSAKAQITNANDPPASAPTARAPVRTAPITSASVARIPAVKGASADAAEIADRIVRECVTASTVRKSQDLQPKAPAAKSPQLRWPLVWAVMITALLSWGYQAHLERYITPQRGLGYWLGIVGGSLMVLLLIYSARKRAPWLRWLGGIPAWFEIHMVLGIVGPVLVLFHSNFRLGATNSNVALISMLLVAGSGVIGRYIYTRLHAQMDGRAETLEQLKAVGEHLRSQTESVAYLPGMVEAVERVERRLIIPPKNKILRLAHLSTGAVRAFLARWMMRREIAQALQKARTLDRPRILRHGSHIAAAARRYAYRRLDAGRRFHEYQIYARIFSLWHVLHIPLFFMLLIAGIAHVVAVNVY